MAQVKYKISGQADNSAIDSAKKGFDSLAISAFKFNNIAATFGTISQALGKIGSAANLTMQKFSTQQNAIAQLTNAIRNNSNLTGSSLKRITDFTTQLQSKGIFGDEELQKQTVYLANMGHTEDKIKDILTASANLAASGIMPLDAAVKNMSKQLSGVGGELSKQIPALQSLTAEQLKAGEGIAIIQKQFAGSLETAALTLEGKTKRAQDVVGDIQEKIGAIFAVGKMSFLDKIQPILENINTWLNANLNRIIQFFLNLPEIATLAFSTIQTMISKVFTIDFWNNYGKNIGSSLFKAFDIALEHIFDAIKTVAKILFAPLTHAWKQFIFAMGTDFAAGLNKVIEGFENIANMIMGNTEQLREAELRAKITDRFDRTKPLGYSKADVDAEVAKEIAKQGGKLDPIKFGRVDESGRAPVNNVPETIGAALKDHNNKLTQALSNIGITFNDVGKDLTGAFADDITAMMKTIEEITGREVPEYIKNMLNPKVATTNPGEEASATTTSSSSSGTDFGFDFGFLNVLGDIMETVGGLFQGLGGNLGAIVQAFASGSPMGLAILAITKIFEGMMSVLGPLIDQVLQPVFDALNMIGIIIGELLAPLFVELAPIISIISNVLLSALLPILNLLTPIISVIAAIFQLLTPVLKANAVAFEILTSPIRFLGDLFKWVANTIRIAVHNLKEYIEHPIRASKRNLQSFESFSSDAFSGLGDRIAAIWNDEGAVSSGAAGSLGGNSASFTGQRDITNNVWVEIENINGNDREAALKFLDEIKSAINLGLASY